MLSPLPPLQAFPDSLTRVNDTRGGKEARDKTTHRVPCYGKKECAWNPEVREYVKFSRGHGSRVFI